MPIPKAVMGLIDFILNLVGLLLWFSWRAIRSDPFQQTAPATIAGTIRRAEAPALKRWHFLGALVLLLLVRGFLYWRISPAVNWTPRINLWVAVLAFRGDAPGPELLFSFLSFLQTLFILYFWLLTIAMVNRGVGDPDPFQKLVLLQLGPVVRWPRWLQAICPVAVVVASWVMLHPLLVRAGVLNPSQSLLHVVGQGVVVGAAVCLSLKYLLPVILVLHLVASYVYFGSSPVWDFIGTTARNVLAPLHPLPLKFGKLDFAPLAGIILILLALQTLPEIIRNELLARRISVWPQ